MIAFHSFMLLLFSHSVMSNSWWTHGQQHTRLPCPSPSPGAWSNSYPLSPWCHPTISSSDIPFSCLQSFPASFLMSPLFASGSLSIGASASASASVLPMNIQDWFPLGLTGFDLLAVQGTLKSLLQHQFKSINSLALSLLHGPTLISIHDYWKNHSFDYTDLCWQSNVSFLIYCLDLS